MKLAAQVKLVVTPEQAQALSETLARANAACNAISEWAWQNQTFGQFAIHKGVYSRIRAEFELAAQMVVRCIAKVADAYKLDKRVPRVFRPTGSIAYDDRILRWQLSKERVSLWTLQGRITLSFVCGEHQRRLLATQQGETDLCCLSGVWFLSAVCNVEEPPAADTSGGFLGVDLGIVQLAIDSEGRHYSGEPVKAMRRRLRRLRSGLQHQAKKRHSQSAYRHLCRLRRHGRRFMSWVNHTISKRLVESALCSRKALVLEDLKGIRERDNGFTGALAHLGREMRWQFGGWAFDQLRQFVVYKARKAGVPVVFIDPRNTSRTCSRCGHCAKENRRSQSHFACQSCGFVVNADCNAAVNIAKHGAAVTGPMDGAQPLAA